MGRRAHEPRCILATASLIYVVSVTYQLLGIDGTKVNKLLNELALYYQKIIKDHARKQ
jgi:hypothetical protein